MPRLILIIVAFVGSRLGTVLPAVEACPSKCGGKSTQSLVDTADLAVVGLRESLLTGLVGSRTCRGSC